VQACALRDGWEDIKEKAHVFGVSTDSLASHVKFQTKHSLPFPLISDADRAIAEAYGVWVEKSMYGKKYMGMERSTFVIGADGKIATVIEKVAPAKHLDLLMKALG
jgi:peroxiredoxin Q/BCP